MKITTIKAENEKIIRSVENKNADELVLALNEIQQKLTSDNFKNNSKDVIIGDYKWALELLSQIFVINGNQGQENQDLLDKIKNLEDDLENTNKLLDTNWTLDKSEKIVKDYEKGWKESNNLVAKKVRKIESLEEEGKSDDKTISKYEKDIETKKIEIKELKNEYDTLSRQNNDLENKNKILEEDYRLLEDKFETANSDWEKKLDKAKEQINKLKSAKKSYEKSWKTIYWQKREKMNG